MHLAWRWFTSLGFDQEIPHHSTYSKNRHGRFQQSKLFEQLFEQIVRQCVEVGLVQGTHLSVGGQMGSFAMLAGSRHYALMRTRDSALRKNNPGYGPERFIYLPESNSYRCPAGEQLNYVGLNARNRAHAYIGSAKRCGSCSQKAQCTSGRHKYLANHMHEPARQRARELAATPAFAHAQRQRKKVEALFAELESDRIAPPAPAPHEVRPRIVFQAAAAQNIKRLDRFLRKVPSPTQVERFYVPG